MEIVHIFLITCKYKNIVYNKKEKYRYLGVIYVFNEEFIKNELHNKLGANLGDFHITEIYNALAQILMQIQIELLPKRGQYSVHNAE